MGRASLGDIKALSAKFVFAIHYQSPIVASSQQSDAMSHGRMIPRTGRTENGAAADHHVCLQPCTQGWFSLRASCFHNHSAEKRCAKQESGAPQRLGHLYNANSFAEGTFERWQLLVHAGHLKAHCPLGRAGKNRGITSPAAYSLWRDASFMRLGTDEKSGAGLRALGDPSRQMFQKNFGSGTSTPCTCKRCSDLLPTCPGTRQKAASDIPRAGSKSRPSRPPSSWEISRASMAGRSSFQQAIHIKMTGA